MQTFSKSINDILASAIDGLNVFPPLGATILGGSRVGSKNSMTLLMFSVKAAHNSWSNFSSNYNSKKAAVNY